MDVENAYRMFVGSQAPPPPTFYDMVGFLAIYTDPVDVMRIVLDALGLSDRSESIKLAEVAFGLIPGQIELVTPIDAEFDTVRFPIYRIPGVDEDSPVSERFQFDEVNLKRYVYSAKIGYRERTKELLISME